MEAESLDPPQIYDEHIRNYGSDAFLFLNDSVTPSLQITDDTLDEGDAFLACFRYTLHLQSRGAKDRMRWLFSMLLY